MPLDRLVLILVCVLIAAAVTVWVGTLVFVSFEFPVMSVALIPIALVAYIVVRVIVQRIGNKTEDHYDGMDN
ncbi:hypothetical protein C1J03_10530 [Sulfitobacter sp. SK012]|uniref:hypothetical protein n=1 Tax=Sulfitobacter sp. SK012 TaxID=1389005 RepID=UPI000E0B3F85|nr:hypothetical protein [Sulfitobacter sp. SK012]AXI46424.1 hypothetical protein C1J03_10530 [Sulfitobacter sp. SK012]